MNLKAHHPGFRVWAGAQADIDRIVAIWSQCFATYGGPYLFGKALTLADAEGPAVEAWTCPTSPTCVDRRHVVAAQHHPNGTNAHADEPLR